MGGNEQGMDIAVIGLSGRFPGARDVDEFWRNLRDGVESLTFFSDEELDESIDPELIRHPDYVKAAPTLAGVDMFDAGFFGYSAREAAILDPAQRMFLECAWEALESAGHTAANFDGSIGVYAGAGSNSTTYYTSNLIRSTAVDFATDGFDLVIANDKDYLGTRVSYKLNLTGPAVSVQTACSTSLVAVHVACQGLLAFECDMALAGGSSVRVPQRSGHLYREGMFESADGHSRPFDARASGLTFGSGMGVVVLKRLEDAVADGDPVQAVIKGSAIGNDGSHKISYVAPSVDGQARAIADALARSGVEPDTVTAIEAHGTSTPVGDPIEVAALTKVYGVTGRTGYCALGSVKSNVGHLDGAAGITGLIKAILQAKNGELVPTLNHTEPNPEIDFARTPFTVNTELRPWRTDGIPRRIGVSAFGVGGTNAHVIVEQPPPARPTTPGRPVQLVPVSARTAAALDEASAGLADALRTADPGDLADVAYTLQVGRAPQRHRRVLAARDPAEAAGLLAGPRPPARVHTGVAAARPKIGFLFTGLGSQYPNMGRDLYEDEPAFAGHLDECARLLEPEAGFDVRRALFSGGDRLRDTAVAQPALFAVEYALARLWQDWGVRPDAMIGHSMGEITAATIAGVFTLEDAARLVAARGRLMGRTEPGAMLSVPLPEQRVRELLPAGLSLAAVNAPDLCVVSGPSEPVTRFRNELAGRDVEGRLLRVGGAYHSALMDPVLEPLRAELERLSPRPPRIPFVSNRTAGWIGDEAATDPGYWTEHVRDTVRFGDGIRLLLDSFGDEPAVLLEVGPGRTLASLARLAGDPGRATVLSSLPHPDDEMSASEFLMTAAGRLWTAGVDLDWAGLHAGERRRRRRLPTYPFQRRRYWIEPDAGPAPRRPSTRDADAPDEEPAPATGVLAPRPDLANAFVAPRGEWERRIAQIWQRLLGIEAIGVEDGFYDLGAESLTFMRVRERIKDDHGVSVPLRPLLKTRTIAELAELAAEVESKGSATSTLDLLRGLAGERAGLPPNKITADTRPAADLHLDPDAVGAILGEAAGALGRPAPQADPGASLGELAALIDDVRPFQVEHVPAERPGTHVGTDGSWSVHAPAGHPLAEPLRAALAGAGVGDGVLLCLPESGEDHIGLFLEAGQRARSAPDGTRFVVVQRDLGASGLARTLHLEHPSAPTTVVELASFTPEAVQPVVTDVAATTGYSEVRYAADGTRTVPVLRALADSAGDPGLDERDVVLATGGGRGITAECVLAMAEDSGARLALLGRGDPDRDPELASNLDRMAAAGVRLRYERADVTSAEAVREAVRRFEADLGPVTAVVHGAGTNEPRELTGLTEEHFRTALAPKIDGLRAVLAAVDADRLTLLLTFGSIIGRAGLRGEAHYATANDWLTELTVRFGHEHPHVRALALEWSVWSGAGMGERLGVVEGLAWEGITPIATGTGIAVLRGVLAEPSAGPVLVVTGPATGLPTLTFES